MGLKFNPFTGSFDQDTDNTTVLDGRYVNVTGDTMTGTLDFDYQGATHLYQNILTVAPGTGADYTTITAALADAVSGDTVVVYPGTYSGNITIPSGVAIVGIDRARTIIAAVAGNRGPVVTFSGSNYLSNLTVRSSTAWTYYMVQWAASGGGADIQGCTVELLAAGDGVQHYGIDTTNMTTGDLIVRNCIVKMNSTTNNLSQTLTCLFINNKSGWGTIDVTGNQFICRGSNGVAQGIRVTTSTYAFPNGRGIYGNRIVAFNQTANANTFAYRQEAGTLTSTDNLISGGVGGAGSLTRGEEFVRRGETNTSEDTIFQPATASEKAVTLRGAASQSANILEVETSASADLFTVSPAGNTLTAGYARVGSVSAPANTTAGDLTATRFSINNATLAAGSGQIVAATGSVTDTSGTVRIYSFQPTITPASNSTATFQALHFLGIWNPATGVTQTALRGFDSGLRIRGDGLVGTVIGFEVAAFATDSSSLSTASATNVYGVESVLYGRPSGTTTSTIGTGIGFRSDLGNSTGLTATNMIGFAVVNPGANTITNLIGMDIPALTRGATNIGVRIALPSGGATANYALQLSDTTGVADGGITFGTDTTLYRSAADTLKTDDKLLVTGEVELDAALNHDGTTIGFFGTAPATQTTVADAGALATTETADGTYDTTEQDMLNNLLTDVTALRTKLNALLDALQSYGLV